MFLPNKIAYLVIEFWFPMICRQQMVSRMISVTRTIVDAITGDPAFSASWWASLTKSGWRICWIVRNIREKTWTYCIKGETLGVLACLVEFWVWKYNRLYIYIYKTLTYRSRRLISYICIRILLSFYESHFLHF